ncbi:CPBP family intramembrane metalloprotease [Candidatus Saccharibacteria bacterium]|nr:CPBP family intramembrane metalloprotease [Candidatus Saccharibacteria bacterium]
MKKPWWQVALWVLATAAWTFVVVVGVQFALWAILVKILPNNILTMPVTNMLFSATGYVLAILILVLLTPRIVQLIKKQNKPEKFSRDKLGLGGLLTWTDIGLAPIGYIASIALAAGLTMLFSLMPWFNASEAQELGYSHYMMGIERGVAFIALVVIAPIAEEIVFRGWLYGKLRVNIPKWVAILITSLVFGAIHMQWNVGITVFAMSVVNCILREITGTIYAGTLVHMINNGVAFYLVYVAMMA